tara:strand:- start:105 stop:320 length:216 start_codon:yes stop_codon:yes gene_type:complete
MPKVDGANFGFSQKDGLSVQKKSDKTGYHVTPKKKPHAGDLVHSFGDKRSSVETRGTGAATKGLDFYRERD